MRIAYVCYWFLLERDGVTNKINAQVAAWREQGHEVEVFCLARVWPSRQTGETTWRTFFFETPVGRQRATARVVDAVEEWGPDAIYLRYELFLPPLPRLLRKYPTVIEINANDKEEAKLRVERPRLAGLYNDVNRRVLLSRARGLVFVTRELARSPHYTSYGKPGEVIANGIDLSTIPPAPPADNARPRVVFLGSARQAWHGVDKIVWLAGAMPEADFDIVGYRTAEMQEVLGSDWVAPPNLNVRGVLARADYEPIIASADLAIGTLALHRKNMEEACPLKVREYLAYGIPVVIAYDDTDLEGSTPWYLLRLPNREDNVQVALESIRGFLADVRGRRVPRDEIADRVGSEAKERRRLAFIERCARDAQ
jgi:glycosyltransferase involved in cell wall biosynthesis